MNRLALGSFIAIFAFLGTLNALLPPLSDDFDAYFDAQKGIESALRFYLNWNARIGELLFRGFIGRWNPFVFDALNAIVGSGLIFAIFVLAFGRIPRHKKDIALLATMLVLILYTTAFGSNFLWGAGSLNYLWGIFFIALFLLPYRFCVETILIGGGQQRHREALLNCLSPFGFVAGMASEQIGVITIIALLCIGFYLRFYRRKSLPLWYMLGFGFFVAGFLCLYLSPGHAKRASLDMFKDAYLSIPKLLELSFMDKLERIAITLQNFTTNTFVIFNITLVAALAMYYKNENKIKIIILCIFLILILIAKNHIASLLYLISFALLYLLIKKDRFYTNIFFIFIIFTLTALSTIQIPVFPHRARLGDSLILISAILLILNHEILDYKKFILISCVIFICYGGYVTSAYIKFRLDYDAMVAYIEEQKQEGNLDITIDGSIFHSYYAKFGDWVNIGQNKDVWPNTSYAKYFGINSIRAR